MIKVIKEVRVKKAIGDILRRRFKGKLRMRLEIMSVDSEEGEQLGMQFGCRE